MSILIKNTIFSFYISIKLELVTNKFIVFIEGFLIVILLIKLNFKLRSTLYKVYSLVSTN
jgi:hypothetical protein